MTNPSVSQSYDVAISFGYKDEAFATHLAGLLEGRLKVFLYSKEQEKLAGTDGEKTFNAVFGAEAKLVVVLYREAVCPCRCLSKRASHSERNVAAMAFAARMSEVFREVRCESPRV